MIHRLTKHIENALYTQDCVLVPGVGALLKHAVPATLDRSKGLIYPGHCSLAFNTAIKHDDGYLATSYARAYAMTFRRAKSLMEGDVKDMQEALKKNGLVQIGAVGRLACDPKGRISFLPNTEHPFSISHYGHAPIARLPIATSHFSKSKRGADKDIVYLPINLRYMRYATVATIVALLSLFMPAEKVRMSNDNIQQYQAGFVPQVKQEAEILPIPTQETDPIDQPKMVDHELAPTRHIAGLLVVTPSVDSLQYYVVISSLRNEEQVQKFVDKFRPLETFPNSSVLVTETGMHRIFTGVYSTLESAQEALKKVHEHDDYADAWIYRQSSK